MPKYRSFSFSISPSNGYSGLISFRIDWFNLLAVQGNLKSLLQHHSAKASILQHSRMDACVQISYPYVTPGKTIVLSRWTFAGKVMSLLFNTLSRLEPFNFMVAVTICCDFGVQVNSLSLCPLFPHLSVMKWHPTPVLLPGKSHGWRSLVGFSPWSR